MLVIVSFLTILTSTMSLSVAARDTINDFRWVNTNHLDLNVRATPSTNAAIRATVPRGGRLWVYHSHTVGSTRWVRVRLTNGTVGYVDSSLLRNTPLPGISETLSGHRYVSTASSPLNIRSGPGSNNSVIASAPRGSRLAVEYAVRVGGTRWVFVRFQNHAGYVSDRYLSNASPATNPPPTVGNFLWPVPGHYRVLSPFGWRASTNSQHNGIDIVQRSGAPASEVDGARVVAVANGRVTHAGWDGGYGITVRIDHGNGIQTLYAHLRRTDVSEGQQISRGQQIGLVGSTGNSQGPHLHFGVIQNGSYVDPRPFLPR